MLCVFGVYYWEVRYLSALGSDGAHELLVGGAMVMTYTWPLWLGFPAITLGFRRYLGSRRVVIAFIPALAIVFPTLVRSVNEAI